MPDVLLFGATGYTGRLTARALHHRQASFSIAGRSRAKLEALAAEVGDVDVHVVEVGDRDGLAAAAEGCSTLISCVGPFVELGDTAVEAALRAGCHYVDSTGEGRFIERLASRYDGFAREAGVALCPAMAFDEVPADVAATMATEHMPEADLVLSYSMPSTPSGGTLLSAVDLLAQPGPFMDDGAAVPVGLGQRDRWAPMPPPLGPRPSISAPLAELHLAPLHLSLRSLGTYVTVSPARRWGAKLMRPTFKLAGSAPARAVLARIAGAMSGPGDEARSAPWTILAEAHSEQRFRNVVLMGKDVYGLSAEFLAAGALKLAHEGHGRAGLLAPVPACGLDFWEKQLIDCGVEISVYEPKD